MGDTNYPALVAGVLCVLLFVRTWYREPEKRARRAFARAARRRASEIDGGTVSVAGRVHLRGEALRAPVSGAPCAAYQVLIRLTEQQVGAQEVVPFLLVDDTGQVLIEPGDAVELVFRPSRQGGMTRPDFRSPTEAANLAALLQDRRPRTPPWSGTESEISYYEYVLLEGDLVGVCGIASREVRVDVVPPHTRQPAEIGVLRGTPHQRLLITDVPDLGG